MSFSTHGWTVLYILFLPCHLVNMGPVLYILLFLPCHLVNMGPVLYILLFLPCHLVNMESFTVHPPISTLSLSKHGICTVHPFSTLSFSKHGSCTIQYPPISTLSFCKHGSWAVHLTSIAFTLTFNYRVPCTSSIFQIKIKFVFNILQYYSNSA